MTEDNKLAKKKKSITDVLSDAYCSLSEAIPGIMTSEKNDFILSVGHLFQAVRRKGFFKQFVDEWNEYREKGKIKEDINPNGPQGDCLQELLEFLDNDCPDEIRFQVMKKIFFVAAAEKEGSRESILPYQYLQFCRKMSSGEVLIMLGAYNLHVSKKQTVFSDPYYKSNWLVSISQETGLKDSELVAFYVEILVNKNIIRKINPDFVYPRDSNELFKEREFNRLTGFGYN